MRPVVIFCPTPEHAAALAKLVETELKLPVSCAASPETARAAQAQGELLVSTTEFAELPDNEYLFVQPPLRAAQVLALIRTRSKGTNTLIKLNDSWEMAPQSKQLVHAPTQQATALTDKEVHILQMLAENIGASVPRDELLKNIWGVTFALDTHTLETHIYRLRNKFRELSPDDESIIAEAGGYRLVS